MLNLEQSQALKMAVDGHNFTLLGSAGTGKSFVISAIAETLKSLGKNVKLTCSTGIACRVYDTKFQATTIHRFAGIDDRRLDPKEIASYIFNCPKHHHVVKRIQETDVLLIDECSMISQRTLESVAEVLSIKDNSVMFGGIQVILCGDFRQLPPVKDLAYGDDGSYCFQASFFDMVFPHSVSLTEVVRQSDQTLIKAIREVSIGKLSTDSIQFLKSMNSKLPPTEYNVHLFARNETVDDFNRKEILNFPGPLYEFHAQDEGDDKQALSKLTAPKNLWIKIGIPVILLRNLTDCLVNGLQGEAYDVDQDGPTVEFRDVGITTRINKIRFEVYSPTLKRNVAVRTQFPLKPAFGITIHKAQGMTLERAHVDCQDIFQPGQLGVAISRVKTTEGLSLQNFSERYCISHPEKVTQFMNRKSGITKDDKSCCRNIRRHDIKAATSSTGECFTTSADVNETEEDQFDEEFNNIVLEMDNNVSDILSFTLPDGFSFDELVKRIKIPNPITTSQLNVNSILEDLPLIKLETFCKKEFLAVSKLIEELNIKEPRAVPSKELVQFYTNIQKHLISFEYKMDCLAVFDHTASAFTDDHMHICFQVHLAVRMFLLQQKANLYQLENQAIRHRFITNPSRARLRYVAGYCVAKLKYHYTNKKVTHRFSMSERSIAIYEECEKCLTVLNLMKEDEETVKASTSEESSLTDIIRKQNLCRSLTHIPDCLFSIFVKLCEQCLKLLVVENLNKYGEEMFFQCLTSLKNNEHIKSLFNEELTNRLNQCDTKLGPVLELTQSKDIRNSIFNKIYEKILKKFLMVFFAQFRKDLKSSYHVEKTMAHRKQIQVSKKKKMKSRTLDSSLTPAEMIPQPSCSTAFDCTPIPVPAPSTSTESEPGTCKPSKSKCRSKRSADSVSGKHATEKNIPSSNSYVDDMGETVWVCPGCNEADDGVQNMIGCDICDDWYHWKCVGISKEPQEELWFCPDCECDSSSVKRRKRRGKKH